MEGSDSPTEVSLNFGNIHVMSGRVVGMQAVVMADPSSAIDQVAISVTPQVGSLDWFRSWRKGSRMMDVIRVLT